jgi:HEPN domain-containing protein
MNNLQYFQPPSLIIIMASICLSPAQSVVYLCQALVGNAPPIHNLQRLAKLAGITLDENKTDKLILISSFNIEARYPDLKRSFRKKCTQQFTEFQIRTIKEIYEWLKGMLS